MDNVDSRRIRKTKTAIFNALHELMQEKRYANISIQNIIDRAYIGRTTFYSHYATKDELLESYISHIFDMLIVEPQSEAETLDALIPIEPIFNHLQGHNRFLKNILHTDSGEMLFQRAEVYWRKKLQTYMENVESESKLPVDLRIHNIIASAIGLIKWWSKNDVPYSPQEMSAFWKILLLDNPAIQ